MYLLGGRKILRITRMINLPEDARTRPRRRDDRPYDAQDHLVPNRVDRARAKHHDYDRDIPSASNSSGPLYSSRDIRSATIPWQFLIVSRVDNTVEIQNLKLGLMISACPFRLAVVMMMLLEKPPTDAGGVVSSLLN